MSVKPIPECSHTLTPYLVTKDAAAAIDFYTRAFGATEIYRMAGPDGKVGHAEMQVGDSRFMLADEHPEMGHVGPVTLGGSPVSLLMYVEDVDRVFAQAIAAGGKALRPVQNQFYGDRSGMLSDPFGHIWSIATHIEDVPPEELQRRVQSMGQ